MFVDIGCCLEDYLNPSDSRVVGFSSKDEFVGFKDLDEVVSFFHKQFLVLFFQDLHVGDL